MATAPPSDKTWPELVGLDAEEAKKKILEEYPDLQVDILKEGSPVTLDFRTDRVRIFKDANNKVVETPRIG